MHQEGELAGSSGMECHVGAEQQTAYDLLNDEVVIVSKDRIMIIEDQRMNPSSSTVFPLSLDAEISAAPNPVPAS